MAALSASAATAGVAHAGSRSKAAEAALPLSSLPDGAATAAAAPAGAGGVTLGQRKVVHFVRHGEGYHNVGFDELEDSPLTSRGWADAAGLKAHLGAMEAMGHPLEVDAVFVSPMTRAMETACGAFGGAELGSEQGEGGSSEGNGAQQGKQPAGKKEGKKDGKGGDDDSCPPAPPKTLMRGQDHLPGRRTAHPGVACVPGLPFIAVEEFRERMSRHACDRRRNLAALAADFPGVDFSLIRHESDVAWMQRHTQSVNEGARGSRYVVAERTPAVIERGTKFVSWLLARPERNMAVVAHREILLRTLGTLAEDAAPGLRKSLSRGFGHCEMRSVVFDELGTPVEVLSETHYPGGAARLYLFPYNWALQKGRKVVDNAAKAWGGGGGGGAEDRQP